MCPRAARRGRGAARNSHVFQAAVCGPLGSSAALRGPEPARPWMQRRGRGCNGASGSRDRRGLCLAIHGTGNETRQGLTWGDAPYPSAAQSKLLISGKAPLLAYPVKIIETAACSPLTIKMIHPVLKLLALVFLRYCRRVCTPRV